MSVYMQANYMQAPIAVYVYAIWGCTFPPALISVTHSACHAYKVKSWL